MLLYRMVQKTVFSECNQLLCHGWRRERQLFRHSVLCHPSADKEIIQKEFEKPKGAKTSHCAVISIREFFPRNNSIIYSSKDLPTKKKAREEVCIQDGVQRKTCLHTIQKRVSFRMAVMLG